MLAPEILYQRLVIDEGYKDKPYLDTHGNITIGIGHNLTSLGLSDPVIKSIFQEDLQLAIDACEKYSWFTSLDDVRQSVLVCMMFNIGPSGFAKFVNMISLLEAHNFQGAANEMEDSLWASQVHGRAAIYAQILRQGLWPSTAG